MKTGEMVRAQGILYKAVVQLVLLYGSNSWVVTRAMLKVIEGFHHRVAINILGITERYNMSGEWE